jgi:hypothetical protein
MRTYRKFWISLPSAALVGLAAACADTPTTAPAAPSAPSLGMTSSASDNSSYTVSQTTVGDTVVTNFVVGTNTQSPATINIGYNSKIDFPYAAGSICDPATSSYGSTERDKPCTAAATSITITAKNWYDASGLPRTEFQPALRFVPGLRKSVTIYLRDRNGQGFGPRVDFCSPSGCINEALTDPSLQTYYDATNDWWYRTIKHFSGYTVTSSSTRK